MAGGYITYDAATTTYELPDEHALALADEDSPVFLGGAFDLMAACWGSEDRILDAFRTGEGVGWHEHHPRLFAGTERFFRPGYRANLTTAWIPSLEGVEAEARGRRPGGRRRVRSRCVGHHHGPGISELPVRGFDYHEGPSTRRGKRAVRPESLTGSNSMSRRPRNTRKRL